MGKTLSPDQQVAKDAVVSALKGRCRELVLVGPAGTGKTTLMGAVARDIIATGRTVAYAAPTGRAAKVLTSKLCRDGVMEHATTIHRALYRVVEEDESGDPVFSVPKAVVAHRGVLICDEASMIDEFLHRDIMSKLPKSAAVLYVGDREQLPPVRGTWGPSFDAPTAALTTVHRQALESPIVRIATDVRQGGRIPRDNDGDGFTWCAANFDAAADWVAERVINRVDATLLVGTNGTRKEVNRMVRERLGFNDVVEPGDRLLVLANNYNVGLMNGEVVEVAAVEPSPPHWGWPEGVRNVTTTGGQTVQVHTGMLDARFAAFRATREDSHHTDDWIHAAHGFALTVHKSQGSEWEEVGFLIDAGLERWCRRDPDTGRRLTYTAITRAANRLTVMDSRSAA